MPNVESAARGFLICLMTLFVVIPVCYLILGAFLPTSNPGEVFLHSFSLDNFKSVWADNTLIPVIVNTWLYSVGSAIVGTLWAFALAWLVERTDYPHKTLIYLFVPVTLALPGLLQAMAWIILLSPKFGFINAAIASLFGGYVGPINIYNMGGMIFVEGLRLVSTGFILLVPLIRNLSFEFDAAAISSGASRWAVISHINIPLLYPGIVAVFFYQVLIAMEVFDVPGVLGLPAGIQVLSTRIYLELETVQALPDLGRANALAVYFLAIAILATWVSTRYSKRADLYSTTAGSKESIHRLGRSGWLAHLIIWSFFIFSVLLPFLALLFVSISPYMQTPSIDGISKLTLDHYRSLADSRRIVSTVVNTLIVSVSVLILSATLAFSIALSVVRSKTIPARLLEQMSFLPHAFPGVVLGLAILWLVFGIDRLFGFETYGSLGSIVFGLTIVFLPFSTRLLVSSLMQVDRSVIESARSSGATLAKTYVSVVFSLLRPAFIALAVYVLMVSFRLAGLPLVLFGGSENEMLSVLIWYLWDEGEIEAVAALGVIIILVLGGLSLLLRDSVRKYSPEAKVIA
ncbi:MAG: iron(III) transport system permease protein [Parasphingorhabdus sp.]|jgi:iron(III) transport system permease protein